MKFFNIKKKMQLKGSYNHLLFFYSEVVRS